MTVTGRCYRRAMEICEKINTRTATPEEIEEFRDISDRVLVMFHEGVRGPSIDDDPDEDEES